MIKHPVSLRTSCSMKVKRWTSSWSILPERLSSIWSILVGSCSNKGILKITGNDKVNIRFVLSPVHFAIILKYIFWLLLLWFCQVFFKGFAIPTNLLHTTLNLALVLLAIRFASFYIKSTFWSRTVYVVCVIIEFFGYLNYGLRPFNCLTA